MWLKEEFIGLEECFKFTHLILSAFSDAMIDQRDSSIEQYLLNFWSKDLSLRDINDRISFCIQQTPYRQQDIFNILFSWIVNQRLQDENASTQWILDDFRKVANLIASNILRSIDLNLDDVELGMKFIDIAVNKFSAKKVRDFMEIQLIHDNDVLIRFLDFFDSKYASKLQNIDMLHAERTGTD